jgi:hypothetical protein
MAISYSYRLKPIPAYNDLLQGIDVTNNRNNVTFTVGSLEQAMRTYALDRGSIWVGNTDNRPDQLPIGLVNQVLTSDGVTANWEYVSGGGGGFTYSLTSAATASGNADLVLTSSSGAEDKVEIVAGGNVDITNIGNNKIVIALASALSSSASYGNDIEAAAGGVSLGQFYRNGSIVQIRML